MKSKFLVLVTVLLMTIAANGAVSTYKDVINADEGDLTKHCPECAFFKFSTIRPVDGDLLEGDEAKSLLENRSEAFGFCFPDATDSLLRARFLAETPGVNKKSILSYLSGTESDALVESATKGEYLGWLVLNREVFGMRPIDDNLPEKVFGKPYEPDQYPYDQMLAWHRMGTAVSACSLYSDSLYNVSFKIPKNTSPERRASLVEILRVQERDLLRDIFLYGISGAQFFEIYKVVGKFSGMVKQLPTLSQVR